MNKTVKHPKRVFPQSIPRFTNRPCAASGIPAPEELVSCVKQMQDSPAPRSGVGRCSEKGVPKPKLLVDKATGRSLQRENAAQQGKAAESP
jgi:hypothetical protein